MRAQRVGGRAMKPRLLALVVLAFWTSLALAERPAPLPKQVDLKVKFDELDLSARQQGARGTCVFFAVTGLANFEYARSMGGRQEPFSEEYLVWAARQATGRSGGTFTRAVRGLNHFGICAESLMPYAAKDDETRTPPADARAAAQKRAKRWQMSWIHHGDSATALSENELTAIKRALLAGHPVGAVFRLPKKMSTDVLQVPSAPDLEGRGPRPPGR
jgi:hypothetical protein